MQWRDDTTEAVILEGLGVRAGVPDLIACRGGRFYALELKTNNGKLSDAQEQVLAALREAGSEVAVSTPRSRSWSAGSCCVGWRDGVGSCARLAWGIRIPYGKWRL
jgi:hypothetical protein